MQQAPATEARRGDLPALAELVARMSSSLEPDEVLDHAIEVCAELTGCQGALVYLWDDEHEHLAVRGASEGYRQWVGRFALAAGEGLTGWTAETRQVGIITDHPQDDPRYLHVPDLNDERFQSVATVPVVGRSDQLLGVLTLHTRAPREFTDQDVTLLRAIAGLVAAAVENAQLHQRALRSVEVFRRLAELSRQLTSASSTARTLQLLAMTTRELLAGDLAAVLQLDESRGRLAVETWAGSGGLRTEPIPAEGPWAQLLGGGPVSVDLGGEPDLSLTAGARSLFAAPLRLEGRPTGLLLCYSVESRSLGGDNLELLGTIANHTSIALEEGRRRDAAAQRTRVRELFDALRAGELRDLGGPHAVVVVETQPTEDAERVWGPLAAELGAQFGGTRVDARPQSLRALVPIASATWAPIAWRRWSSRTWRRSTAAPASPSRPSGTTRWRSARPRSPPRSPAPAAIAGCASTPTSARSATSGRSPARARPTRSRRQSPGCPRSTRSAAASCSGRSRCTSSTRATRARPPPRSSFTATRCASACAASPT